MSPFERDESAEGTSPPPVPPPEGMADIGPAGQPPSRQRRLSWRGRLVLIGGLVLTLLLIGGSALAHTLMHVTGSGMCGGG